MMLAGRASRSLRNRHIAAAAADYDVPRFQDRSFSNGTHMESIDFRYRLSDQGRIVLGPLSSEETLEFEELTRRDREGLIDLTSELRLLELYVKYIGSDAKVSLAPFESAPHVIQMSRRQQPRRRARRRNLAIPMIAIMGMSFMLICTVDQLMNARVASASSA
ncbi:hypothetical protein ACFQZO_04350 [Bradyrhizobium sp. GCM10027634]|uniref:hypothetical protein n=1 Tax=unclassified Bradyrhizobium TaxID=2631580 RepID=UPI001FEF2C4C|nr:MULTISPECIES: hypothetical protein [unclassified Bradyrhizobium]MDN5000113.1 hypothetical protein [Bradyrhizobium sp. WYCCWR 12677]